MPVKNITYILIFAITLFGLSCRKPRLGNYDLKLNYYAGYENSIQLMETKATHKIIYYGGDAMLNSGYLNKSKNNVSGQITGYLESTSKFPYTLYLVGKISTNGFLQYKITGTFKQDNGEEGSFEIIKTTTN